MIVDAHISCRKAKVRRGALHRHDGRRLDNGKAFAIAGGLGLPRTWRISTDAVLDGFEAGLASSTRRGGERLEDAYELGRNSLARRCDALVDKALPDATFAGMAMDQGVLHIMGTAPGRVYLHRRGKATRLTSRDEGAFGVLEGKAVRTEIALEPEDVILLGSGSSFSTSAIAKVASVLDADAKTAPSVLASILTGPAGVAGAGAAAIVLRVR